MDIDAVFLPVAEELIDQVFPNTYSVPANRRTRFMTLMTGQTAPQVVTYSINAGILSRGRNEQGGIGEDYELRLWIHHGPAGLLCCQRPVIASITTTCTGRFTSRPHV